ncbi:MAG: UDP-3-O-acyl-N-acetylglucosamine deacetylase [Pseudomonadota bacterium]
MVRSNGKQTTLAADVVVDGIGVHSGAPVRLTVRPASADTGIVFSRSDLSDRIVVPARYHLVSDTSLCTVVGVQPGPGVSTVEHLMAALAGLGVDNASVELDGPEMPIMDGSSARFVDAIQAVGIVTQSRTRRVIRVLKPVSIEVGDTKAELLPHDHFRIEATIDFAHPVIGRQSFVYDEVETDFETEIAPARTFGFFKDVEAIRAAGLARGASLDNTVVVGDDAVMNADGLRFADEFVRHKVLDAVGDLALAGFQLQGLYRVERPGHRLNHAILTALFSQQGAWVLTDAPTRSTVPGAAVPAITGAALAPEI